MVITHFCGEVCGVIPFVGADPFCLSFFINFYHFYHFLSFFSFPSPSLAVALSRRGYIYIPLYFLGSSLTSVLFLLISPYCPQCPLNPVFSLTWCVFLSDCDMTLM